MRHSKTGHHLSLRLAVQGDRHRRRHPCPGRQRGMPGTRRHNPVKNQLRWQAVVQKQLTQLNFMNGIRGCKEIKKRGYFLTAPKYCSLNVEIEVVDEASRLAIYQNLKNHLAVKAVL